MPTNLFDKSDYRYARVSLAANGSNLLAAAIRCSQNIESGSVWGYNEITTKRSTDGGKTWSEENVILTPPARKITAEADNTKSSFFQNPQLLFSGGEYVLLFTFFPESMGAEEEQLLDKKKAAYTYFNNNTRPIIYDRDGNYYIIAENGKVLTSAKATTEYTVRDMGELFSGEEYIGNIYLNGAMGKSDGVGKTTFGAPLKAPKRSYIMVMKSADGIRWSKPVDITSQILNDADGAVLITGEGNGTVTSEGKIIVPLYSDKGALCIYSYDGGVTWSRNRHIPYMPTKDSALSLVQLPGGELLALGSKWCISHDKGITWMKEKAKATPSCAVCRGDRLFLIIHSAKVGTYLLGCDIISKKGKFKTVKPDKNTTALPGAFFPAAQLAFCSDKLAILHISDDYTNVAIDTTEV
ncbi:MAG: exo-alpha-sialidase [Ruminococcaceae bacterium]|nr:exo-alpha-sialidase [Oscillospiraceae bacterium]